MIASPKPQRGEIWTADLGGKRHWVLVISLNSRNFSDRTSSVLVVPFGSYGAEGPTCTALPAGETGLPGISYLKGHFIQVAEKTALIERQPRMLSAARLRQAVELVRRAIDPDAPWPGT